MSKTQSTYTHFRSTSDIVWEKSWLITRIEIYQERLLITENGMSAAFDTIIRARLIKIVCSFLEGDGDEVRIIRHPLSNPRLTVKIYGNEQGKSIISNIGSSQENSLSGKLYNIYFEASFHELP